MLRILKNVVPPSPDKASPSAGPTSARQDEPVQAAKAPSAKPAASSAAGTHATARPVVPSAAWDAVRGKLQDRLAAATQGLGDPTLAPPRPEPSKPTPR